MRRKSLFLALGLAAAMMALAAPAIAAGPFLTSDPVTNVDYFKLSSSPAVNWLPAKITPSAPGKLSVDLGQAAAGQTITVTITPCRMGNALWGTAEVCQSPVNFTFQRPPEAQPSPLVNVRIEATVP